MPSYQHALCLYPYIVDQRPGVGIFPPTGLEYIATALKGHVGRISLIDLRHERNLQPIEALTEFIERGGVDLLCISIGWRARYERVTRYVAQLPAHVTTVAGGYEATEQVEDIFQRCPNVNGIVRGEGEQTIVELADGVPWERILGLSFRKEDGSLHHNDNRPLASIDTIAPPDRTLRRSKYCPTLRGVRLMNKQFDTLLASRGCPYKCEFCSLVLNPLGQLRGYVSRSAESVVAEIESSPADIIMFADDIFFLEPRKAEELCDLLISRGIKKNYIVQCRIEVYKFPRMLEKAWKAGFRALLFGIESASDHILKSMHKGFTTDKCREAFAVLRKFPFWMHGYFIYGCVGETEEEMLSVTRFARELGLHSISLSQLRMDKFTPWRKTVEQTPGYRISSNGYVYSDRIDKKRMRQIRNRIRNGFQYHPAQIAKMVRKLNDSSIVTGPEMLRLVGLSPVVGWDYLLHRLAKRHRRTGTAESPAISKFGRQPAKLGNSAMRAPVGRPTGESKPGSNDAGAELAPVGAEA